MAEERDRVGIEFISVIGMPPPDFVRFADAMGVGHIGLALAPILQANPHGYPAWSLRDEPALLRETLAALRDTGVGVSVGEGFLGWPGTAVADFAADLDIMAEMGAGCVNILALDPDPAACIAQFAQFAELASSRGLKSVTEYLPGFAIGDFAAASDAVRQIGNPDFSILVDTMHYFRSGSTVAEIATAAPELTGYIQLCDVPIVSTYGDYGYEAQFHRLAPGEGELPLGAFLAAAPKAPIVGLEVPRLDLAEAGVGPAERIGPAIAAARALLAAT